MRRSKVIAIRAGPQPMASRIYRCLDDGGIDHVEVGRPCDVPAALAGDGADAVLVFNAKPGAPAQELLRVLRQGWSDVPVIVVVEESDFDEYYELMSDGAYDYYAMDEGPEVIAEALRWAAHTHAVPPRALSSARLNQESDLTVGAA